MKQHIRTIRPYVELVRDTKTGIAEVENGSTGNGHSCHANIDKTGSVKGMKKLGYWKEDARTVKSGGFIFNIDTYVVTDELDQIAADECRCQACIERKAAQ